MERNIKEEKREKTTFSLTCSLLSQYMKEKKSFGGLGFEMNLEQGARGIFRPPTTMNLMPGIDASLEHHHHVIDLNPPESAEVHLPERTSDAAVSHDGQNSKEAEKAQLTIFYGGKVLVFDNFPGGKVEELMQMATAAGGGGGGGGVTAENFGFATAPASAAAAAFPAAASGGGHVAATQRALPSTIQTNASDMPIMRRKSLHRFLEKRKDRINSKAPYQANEAKPEENKPWLALSCENSG